MKALITLIPDEGETYKELAAKCRNMEQASCPNIFFCDCPMGKPCQKVRTTDWKHLIEDGFSVKGSIR